MAYKGIKNGSIVEIIMKGYTKQQNKGILKGKVRGNKILKVKWAEKYGGMHRVYFPYDKYEGFIFGMHIKRWKD